MFTQQTEQPEIVEQNEQSKDEKKITNTSEDVVEEDLERIEIVKNNTFETVGGESITNGEVRQQPTPLPTTPKTEEIITITTTTTTTTPLSE